MGTHPIFESDFDCLTDECYRYVAVFISSFLHAAKTRRNSKETVGDVVFDRAQALCRQKASIDRRASVQLIQAVFDDLHRRGHLHWLDKQCQRGFICPITFAALANAVYTWAQASGNINQVCTFYELTNGDDIVGEVFEGLDEGVLKIALRQLQKEKKAEVIGEDGVKFF